MYIRTKDGVYELVDNLYQYHNGVEKFWYAKEENGTTLAIEITANEILKQADTVEELCDEFIDIIPRENGKAYHDHWEWSAEEKRFNNDIGESVPFDYFSDNTDFRGAIWTDKGLIYVAKMDENGELELI